MSRTLTIAILAGFAVAALPAAASPAPAPDAFFAQKAPRGAFLGIRMSNLDDEKARDLGVSASGGVRIDEVFEDTAAEEAGLREGDVLLSFDGERVRSVAQAARLVGETAVGRTVRLDVLRDGSPLTLEARLRERQPFAGFRVAPVPPVPHVPGVPAAPFPPSFPFDGEGFHHAFRYSTGPAWRIGLVGEDLGGQLAEFFDVDQGRGVLVKEVVEGSPAEAAGLRAGDVLVGLDDARLGSLEELRKLLEDDERDAAAALVIVRKGRERSLPVVMEKLERPELDFFDGAQLREQAEQYREQAQQLREQAEQYREQQRAWREEARERAREMRDQERELERRAREEARQLQRQSRPAPQPDRLFAPQPIAAPAAPPAPPARVPSEPLHY